MKFTKYMVSLLLLIQAVGCGAMDVPMMGNPSNVVLKNASGYAIEVVVAYHNNQHRRVIIDPGQEDNLGPLSNLVSFKYAGYGELWAKTSLWNEYSSAQVNILRQNQQVGIDLVLTISTWVQKFFVDKQIEFRPQPGTGAVQTGGPQLPRRGMLILKWFPRVYMKLLKLGKPYTPVALSWMDIAEMEGLIKARRDNGTIDDYYFLRLPPDATKNEIENEYRWLRDQVAQSLTRLDDEREIVLEFLSEAKDRMLQKLK